MGNKKNRERMKEVMAANEWERLRSEHRPFHSDIHFQGIGIRRLQLIFAPSFEPGHSWDIRQLQDQWRVFRSDVVEHNSLTNYTELDATRLPLVDWFNRLSVLTISLQPLLNGMAGADGTTYHLEISGDMHSSIRFCWWSEYPPAWKPLIEQAEHFIDSLQNCPPKSE